MLSIPTIHKSTLNNHVSSTFTMSSRACPLSASAASDHRRAGDADRLLAAHRRRDEPVVSERSAGRGELSALFLSRHGADDFAVHRDIFDDFGDRGSARGIFAGGAGGAGEPDVD